MHHRHKPSSPSAIATATPAAATAEAASAVSTAVESLASPPQVDGTGVCLPGGDSSADGQALGDDGPLLDGVPAVVDDEPASPKGAGTELAVDSPIFVEEKELPVSCLGDFKFTFMVRYVCRRRSECCRMMALFFL